MPREANFCIVTVWDLDNSFDVTANGTSYTFKISNNQKESGTGDKGGTGTLNKLRTLKPVNRENDKTF